MVCNNSTLNLTGINTFMDNSARQNGCGGGISVDDSTLNLTGNSIFIDNSAIEGGGIDAINSNMVSYF